MKIVKVSESRTFPLELNSLWLARFATSIINEGHISHNRDVFLYYNKDPILHKLLRKSILEIFGIRLRMPVIKGNHNVLQTRFYGIPSRILIKIGVLRGSKSNDKLRIPKFVSDNEDFVVAHFQHVMAEEMSAFFNIKCPRNHKYLGLFLSYGRSQDITNYISEYVNKKIEYGRKIYITNLSSDLRNRIKRNPLPILLAEKQKLHSLGIKSSIRPVHLYKVAKNRIRVFWILTIGENRSIELFYKKIVSSYKSDCVPVKLKESKAKYAFWKKCRGRKLNAKDLNEIRRIRMKWKKLKNRRVKS